MELIKQATIFLDLQAEELRQVVHQAMPRCAKVVDASGSFIRHWEDGRKVITYPIDDTPEMCKYEALVTDKGIDRAHVAYAIFRRKIPVLVLGSLTDEEETMYESPLLCTLKSLKAASSEDAIRSFFTFPEKRGRVIVIEGGDGAGKQTQTALLMERLEKEGHVAKTLDFPHDSADYGLLIRKLLSGALGDMKQLDPLMFSMLYSLNREALLPHMKFWIHKGYHVVLDRYMTANFGHQASKFADDAARDERIEKLHRVETTWFGLPDADLVLYLNLPPEVAMTAMKGDGTRQVLDIHETAVMGYKENVRRAFLWCCKRFDTWRDVACMSPESERLPRGEVHETIFRLVREMLESA